MKKQDSESQEECTVVVCIGVGLSILATAQLFYLVAAM